MEGTKGQCDHAVRKIEEITSVSKTGCELIIVNVVNRFNLIEIDIYSMHVT